MYPEVMPFGRGDDVGDDVVVLDAEPLPRPAPGGHDLVRDEEDPVLIAELAQALHVALRRRDDPVGADDRLDDDGGNRLGVVVHELLFENGKRLLPALLLVLGAEGAAVRIRTEEVHHAGDARLGGPAARISRQRDGPRRGAVVALPGRVDLVPAGEPARGLDGVLIRLRAAVGEQHVVQVSRCHLRHHGGELGLGLGAETRGHEAELVHLRLHGVQDVLVAVPQVDVQQARAAVHDPAAVRVVHVDALGMVDHRGQSAALSLPAVDDVLAVQLLQFLGLHYLLSSAPSGQSFQRSFAVFSRQCRSTFAPASQSSHVVFSTSTWLRAADARHEDHCRGADLVHVAGIMPRAAHHVQVRVSQFLRRVQHPLHQLLVEWRMGDPPGFLYPHGSPSPGTLSPGNPSSAAPRPSAHGRHPRTECPR